MNIRKKSAEYDLGAQWAVQLALDDKMLSVAELFAVEMQCCPELFTPLQHTDWQAGFDEVVACLNS